MLDELDKKIIGELGRSGFEKGARVAQVLDIGERTVRRRINKLIANNSIEIIAVPNPVICGFKAWGAIGIRVEPRYLNQVTAEVVPHPWVYFAAYALGRFDVIIGVHFDTIGKLTHFVNSELVWMKGIESVETWILSSPRKYYHFSWPAPVYQKTGDFWQPYSEPAARRGYQIDGTDRKIFGILKENGLATPGSLKSILGIGEATIRKRINNMVSHNLYKLEAVPNPEIMENEEWATVCITVTNRNAHDVIDDIIKNPAVYLASVTLGKVNIMISCRFGSTGQMEQFVRTVLPSIPGISSIETFLHNKPLKYHNVIWAHPVVNGKPGQQLSKS